jgi:hypothetical protein
MHTGSPVAAYLFAVAVIVRAAAGLAVHALRRPGTTLALSRDGRVVRQ